MQRPLETLSDGRALITARTALFSDLWTSNSQPAEFAGINHLCRYEPVQFFVEQHAVFSLLFIGNLKAISAHNKIPMDGAAQVLSLTIGSFCKHRLGFVQPIKLLVTHCRAQCPDRDGAVNWIEKAAFYKQTITCWCIKQLCIKIIA